MNEYKSIQDKSEQVITIAALLIICIISFIPFNLLSSPAIASDDWSLIVAPSVFGELAPFNLTNHRPIDMSLYYGLTSIIGIRLEYFYLLNALILFLSAVMVYALVKRVFPQHSWLAALTAIAYLVYPVDYTRTWLIMLYIRFWWLISLGTIWLLLDFAESGSKWKFALALAGIIIPLGAYEGQFGVVVTATFLIAYFFRTKPVKRRLVLLASILLVSFLFYLWRFHIQANLPGIRYYSAGAFQFNLAVIIERYIQGFNVFLLEWLAPVQDQLGLTRGQLIVWSILYASLCTLATLFIFNKNNLTYRLPITEKLPILKSQFFLFLMGGVFWAAGYFPIVGLYSPSVSGHASRVNLYAVAGAALVVASIVFMLSTSLARSITQFRLLSIAFILPFILTGIFVQLQVNKENRIAWETQRSIWNGVLKTIPNIGAEKRLVILIPGYEKLRPLQTYPFTTAWEVDAGAKVLYNNPAIGGYYYYKDLHDQQFKFTKNGINPPGTERLVGYKRLIFALYNPEDKSVELVENVEETLSLPFVIDNYAPHENIVPIEPSTAEFRWLIE